MAIKLMKQVLASFKLRIFFFSERFRSKIQIQKEGKFFKIIIPKTFKKYIKIIKFFLTTISLLSSLYQFNSIITSFIFALITYLILSLIDKTIFSYSSLYVHTYPDFEVLSEKWKGVAFGFGKQQGNPYDIPILSLLFEDEEYARNIYSLILKWSYGNVIDKEKNINISVILDEKDYVFFIYPSFNRKTAQDFFNEVKISNNDNPTDIHQEKHFIFILGKKFPISKNSYYNQFKSRYQEGIPFLLEFHYSDGSSIQKVKNLEDLVLFSLKFKNKDQLTRKDIEYGLFKAIPLINRTES